MARPIADSAAANSQDEENENLPGEILKIVGERHEIHIHGQAASIDSHQQNEQVLPVQKDSDDTLMAKGSRPESGNERVTNLNMVSLGISLFNRHLQDADTILRLDENLLIRIAYLDFFAPGRSEQSPKSCRPTESMEASSKG